MVKKILLHDVAFLIIVKYDSIIRLENTVHVINYLANNFDANIYVWEVGTFYNGFAEKLISNDINYSFHEDYDPILHRTRYINQMLNSVTETYVSIWDVDVIASVSQISQSVELLREGVDFVYPYEKYFFDTSDVLRNLYLKNRDISLLDDYKSFMKEMYPPNPVGGSFFANRQSYLESGAENENFYGWGLEDGERFERWKNLGFIIKRVEGPLYHLSHPRGLNSVILHSDHSIDKQRELLKSIRRSKR